MRDFFVMTVRTTSGSSATYRAEALVSAPRKWWQFWKPATKWVQVEPNTDLWNEVYPPAFWEQVSQPAPEGPKP